MEPIYFAQLTYVVLTVVLALISAALLYHSPLAKTEQNLATINYFGSFFIATGLGFLALLLRPLYNEAISIAVVNFLLLINFYSLRFGLLSRLGRAEKLHKSLPVYAHHILFVGSQLLSYYWLTDSAWFRITNGAVNSIIVLLGCLTLVRISPHSLTHGEKLTKISIKFIIMALAIVPILYFLSINLFYYQTLFLVVQVITLFVLMGALLSLLMSDLIEQYYQKSIKDPLTGIYNRRYFFQHIEHIAEQDHFRASTLDRPYSVILTDIDKFKSINDKYGHDVGDMVLVEFATMLEKTVGRQGIVARFGGEEFTLLLHNFRLGTATEFAEILRLKCADIRIPYQGAEIGITASFGVAEVWDLTDIDLAIKLADDALLKAKVSGRNRVITR